MLLRALAALGLLVAGLAAGAAPAGAQTRADDFRLPGRMHCDAPGGWSVLVTPTGDTQRRAATARYSLAGPDGVRGSLDLPLGSGRLSVLELEVEAADVHVVSTRRGMTGLARHTCRAADRGAPMARAEVVYLAAPRRPTTAQVEAYCADFAARAGEDDWEAQRCVSWFSQSVRGTARP
jgi:hypothetical protein